ncbi:hypothetical protein ACTWPB_14060 [Nocardia sp. IBHARD005]|uniref:hypothetical protein n=1 Tax=Nocardia sp. IBHARD005 TaxID=3457765 RepID=UPI0040597AE1
MMTVTRLFLRTAAAAIVAVTFSACQAGTNVNEKLTMRDAQTQSIEYLTKMLGTLPRSAYLDLEHSPTGTKFSSGSLASCDDNAPGGTSPVNLGLQYWVLGIDKAEADHNVDLVADSWTRAGIPVDRKRGTGDYHVYADTSDGYRLVVGHNTFNDVTVIASSPCFPRPPANERPDAPTRIDHP